MSLAEPPRSSLISELRNILPLLVVASAGFISWGVLTNRLDGLAEQRVEDRAQLQACTAAQTSLQVRVATIETEAAGTRRVLDTELAGLRREMERVATAVERLTEVRNARAQR